MNTAERIVNTVNDAITIAGLEMLNEPQLMRYETRQERQMMKRYHQQQFRINVIRRVLRADLKQNLAQLPKLRDQETLFEHARYCDTLKKLAEKVPDRNLLPAVQKLQNIFTRVGFAEHCRMMNDILSTDERPSITLGKQTFHAA